MSTLSEAIFQKFNDVNSDIDNPEFVIISLKIDAQQGIPPVLVISSRNVNKAGDPNELRKVLSNVVELDISHNLISDLQEIGVIFQNAPKLRFINIGFNPLSTVEIPSSPSEFPVVDSLKTLILVGTQIPWAVVWFLLCHARNVAELHLSLNQYAHVELPKSAEHPFNSVEKLMFDGNPISSWQDISKLGIAFPQLNHLSLTESPIQVIPINGGEHFKSLKTLWLSNTDISKLEDFENLKHFSVLTDLRVNGIPFLGDFNEEVRRQHYIALLPNILTLNRGRTITQDDRITAERNFVRHYLDHSSPPARYQELKEIHGEVHKLVEVSFKPPTKANLVIFYEDKKFCRVDVPLKKTVKELKDFLEPIVGLVATNMDLFYLAPFDDADNVGKEIMRFPTRQLYTYHMNNNDEIHVHRKATIDVVDKLAL